METNLKTSEQLRVEWFNSNLGLVQKMLQVDAQIESWEHLALVSRFKGDYLKLEKLDYEIEALYALQCELRKAHHQI